MNTRRKIIATTIGAHLLCACTITRDAGSLGSGDSGSSTDPDDTSSAGTADSSSDVSSEPQLDLAGADTSTEECASVTQSTVIQEGPSDILIVIDQAVAATPVDSILSNFSMLIANDNIMDLQVVLMAGYPADGGGACIDEPPLGVGECPANDHNPPMYRHIDETIAAPTLLDQVLARADQWQPALREGAWKHVWILSGADAESSTDDFVDALLAIDEGFDRLTVHAMVPTEATPDCSAIVGGGSIEAGQAYVDLATATGGIVVPLCDYNVDELFNGLLDSIQTVALSCSYDIPEPPAGEVFQQDEVNVDYDDGFGLQTIGHVETPADCASVGNGWYYDAALPTKILMCPQTCQRFGVLSNASIEIRFGCATVPAA